MEKKINIAKLLKDCPRGMELDCAMCYGLEFDGINTESINAPIRCRLKNSDGIYKIYNFTKYGCWSNLDYAKCVIFPKGKTTWEGFVPPVKFKDGDILTTNRGSIFIYKGPMYYNDNLADFYCGYRVTDRALVLKNWHDVHFGYIDENRLATEEEKQKLFDTIKANGYKWNDENKTLEKLIKPKFKVGDKVKHKNGKDKNGVKYGIILSITDDTYDVAATNNMGIFVPIADQDEWELVPNKFDISTLKPFDKVLVRGNVGQKWTLDFFGFIDKDKTYPFVCVGHYVPQCIPYNDDTKHLLGKTDECDEHYKTWRE